MWQTKLDAHIVGEENVKQIEVWEFDKCDNATHSQYATASPLPTHTYIYTFIN